MENQNLKTPVLLLALLLVVVLTLTVFGSLDLIVFWVLAGISAIFAFKILPGMKQ